MGYGDVVVHGDIWNVVVGLALFFFLCGLILLCRALFWREPEPRALPLDEAGGRFEPPPPRPAVPATPTRRR